MRTMTATEASRGFSELLDSVALGEVVTVTRGGRVIAEIRPASRKSGRDLRLALEQGDGLGDDDAEEMLRSIEETRSLLLPQESVGDPWAGG